MARQDCTEWALTIHDLAMNIASRPESGDLNQVVAAMNKNTGLGLDRITVERAINEVVHQEKREVAEATKQIRRIKTEANITPKLRKELEALIEAMENSTEQPVTVQKAKSQASRVVKMYRAVILGMKSHARKQEGPQLARLQKNIEELEALMAKGDFTPKVTPARTPKTLAVERKEFELAKLRRDFNRQIMSFEPKTPWGKAFNVANLGRALMTSFDLSGALRQGGQLSFANPTVAVNAYRNMFRSLKSDQEAFTANAAIGNRDQAVWYEKAKLFLSDIDGSLSQKEEAYQTTLIDKLGIVGKGIRISERAYVTFLNTLRADVFDSMVNDLAGGYGNLTLEEAKNIADFVNNASGRGSLKGAEGAAIALNATLFSPRLLTSRFAIIFNLFKAFTPGVKTFGATGEVKKLIRRQYVKYLAGISTFYAMAFLAFGDDDDFDIEWNPKSSDFGKIRFGNTRIDPLSGLSQTTVLLARAITGETVSAATGNTRKIVGDIAFGGQGLIDVGSAFMRNKLSPWLGTIVNLRTGTNFIGEPNTPTSLAKGLFIPMSFGDLYETFLDQGFSKGSALSMLSIFGMSLQTWGTSFETMTQPELRKTLKDHTFHETKIIERTIDGQKVRIRVRKGQAHLGEEGRVAAIKNELAARAK